MKGIFAFSSSRKKKLVRQILSISNVLHQTIKRLGIDPEGDGNTLLSNVCT